MFIVFGILSILAGAFVFKQSTALSMLASFAQSKDMSAVSGGFTITAICMIIAGALACACGGGNKRGMVKGSVTCHFIAALVCLLTFVGDLQIWAFVNAIVAIIYLIWMHKHKQDTQSVPASEPAEPAVQEVAQPSDGAADNAEE